MKKLRYCLLGLLLPVFTTQAQDKFPAATADSLFNSLHEEGTFNGNVLLAEKGKVLYRKSIGLANESTRAPPG